MSFLAGTKKNRFIPVLGVCCAFLGTASSVFAQGLEFSTAGLTTGYGPVTVVPVDVNGNGHPGLVCANTGFEGDINFGLGGGGGTTLSVFTNDGFGNLSFNATLTVGRDPVGVAVA